MNRRDAIKLTTAAMIGASHAGKAFAASKPLRVLILGGTGFIGPHFVAALQAHGHALTLFNRGKRNAALFPDIETLLGDRDGQLDALGGREWDAVVDNSGYVPRHVDLSAELLSGRVGQYVFISSISAYANLSAPGIDEDYATAQLADPAVEVVNGETYGGLKAACERVIERTFGTKATIIRPTYIVGPGDHTDRFTYWPVRVSRGGEMLAPGSERDPIQFIDVRDLAEFTRGCVERGVAGRYNACNPPGAVTIGDLLQTSKRISRSDARFVWAPSAFLEANQALTSGEFPIWAPTTGDDAGATLVSSARAVSQGLRFRELAATVADTLAWYSARPAQQRTHLRAGLSPEREAQLLKKLKG